VRQRPYSVVLLDECEKADLEVMNLFYQVFDKGLLTDSEGREVDFKNTLVILTSNLATDAIMAMREGGRTPTSAEVVEAIRPILSAHFKPALLARMTVVPFSPLPAEVLREIVDGKLAALARRVEQSHRLKTRYAPEVFDHLVAKCTDPEAGARNVDHVLRGSLMAALSQALLERLVAGPLPAEVAIGVGADGGFQVSFVEAG